MRVSWQIGFASARSVCLGNKTNDLLPWHYDASSTSSTRLGQAKMGRRFIIPTEHCLPSDDPDWASEWVDVPIGQREHKHTKFD